ncbi:hypothetical protein [Dickeya zeae]|uniref:hypothetical protein n=1 Tax=Dickeya zeae TaxID=204042 RepID=UPI0003A9ACA2|nr:hypothetical protein [Dickeya zeae]
MNKLIFEMAKRIENRWVMSDNDYRIFPDIAKEEMSRYELHKEFDYKDIITFLNDSYVQNVQISSDFSDLHVKLFDNGKFYVEVLTWFDKDTAIHDHGFTGVLQQLKGVSLNAAYGFNERKIVSQNLALGNSWLCDAEILNPGDFHSIYPGREEKHAVFHIEKPTISIIVRTHPITELPAQLNYFPPFIRVNHSEAGLVFKKMINFFLNLNRYDEKSFSSTLLNSMGAWSYTENFWAIVKLSRLIFTPNNIDVISAYLNSSKNDIDHEIRKEIIASATFRSYSQFITNTVKPKFNDYSVRLALSALAACYTEEDLTLMEGKVGINIKNTIEKQVYPHISVDDENKLRRIIKSIFLD